MSDIKTVLLIEDDQFISDLYVRALKKAGFDVDTVVTGPEGLGMAKTGKYDLILLDLMLPDLTGVDVLEELRGKKGDKLPDTRIIITTNLDQDDNTRSKMEEMADGYLIKADVTPKKLVEIIRQVEQFGKITDED